MEKGVATHSRIHAWRIPRTEEPGGLQSMGSQSRTRLNDKHPRTHKHTQECGAVQFRGFVSAYCR